ncbi:polysaccharide lyase family 7 protein [Bacteroides nordii]|uniref:polysaccharide lyase family 7 protein n=1 Tax=Bacteroides nordii TaxID=291645 RepID=UPI00351FF02D
MSACGGDEDEPIKDDVPIPELYGPKHGTGWVEHTYDYYIQKPWNLNLEERYAYDKENDEHTFKIIKGDEPFKQGDHTSPRCELRMRNDYTEGNHQFEADYYVVEGTHRTAVMQIFGYPVAINIKAYEENGGTLKWHDSHDIVSPVYNKWVHLNVVHMFTERQIYVYVDGKLIRSF